MDNWTQYASMFSGGGSKGSSGGDAISSSADSHVTFGGIGINPLYVVAGLGGLLFMGIIAILVLKE